mmetsp:Transcript_2981/g.5088  ORF Transcript_2981/g.5088 Transcript_2981/m.5088 type:complete len:84 (-) Transcript_2981:62-313(-)
MGLSDLGRSPDDRVQVEHVLVLSLAPTWREPLLRALQTWSDTSKLTLGTLKIVGYGVAAYFVLAGISKVIDSIQGKDTKRLDR